MFTDDAYWDSANPLRVAMSATPWEREGRAEYEYFTGRTEAAEMVEIRSRVTGYLTKAPLSKNEARNGEVKEGDDVKAGQMLFEIDPAPYQAEVDRAEANIKQYQALVARLSADYGRARGLLDSGSARDKD